MCRGISGGRTLSFEDLLVELLRVNVSTIKAWCQSGVLDGIQGYRMGPGGSS